MDEMGDWGGDGDTGGGDDDFGGNLQFTSHAGMTLRWQEISLSYRIQHTSNASIYEQNKGLNLHLVGLGGRF